MIKAYVLLAAIATNVISIIAIASACIIKGSINTDDRFKLGFLVVGILMFWLFYYARNKIVAWRFWPACFLITTVFSILPAWSILYELLQP